MTETAQPNAAPPQAHEAPISLRPATTEDVAACLDVFYEAGEELHARTGQPAMPRNPAPLGKLFAHLITTDPERSWIAVTSSGRVVGFGLALLRDSAWFLSFLFVRPAEQAGGLGRRMLEACVGPGADLLATCIEAIQPVSAGLYATFGMAPLAPLYVMTGRLRDTRPLATQHVLSAERVEGPDPHPAIDDIDRATLGYAHPDDHRFWVAMDRFPYLFRDATGDPRGYGYVATSGRIGPVAMLDAELLPEAIDHLMATIEPPDAWLLFVPGQSKAVMPLLRAGLRFDGAPAIYCSTGGHPDFSRYLIGNFAVL